MASTKVQDDISGVPSMQLSEIVRRFMTGSLADLAKRVNTDPRYLKRMVIEPTSPVVRLDIADKVLLEFDLDVSDLVARGDLDIVPLRPSRSGARRIVEEEVWLAESNGDPTLTKEEIEERIDELLDLYDRTCTLTPAMIKARSRVRKE